MYDFETDSWSQLPDPPESSWPAVPDLVWTGEELIVVGGRAASLLNLRSCDYLYRGSSMAELEALARGIRLAGEPSTAA